MSGPYSKDRFVEVRVNGARVVLINPRLTGNVVVGYRVNKDGSRWEKETADAVTQNLVVTSAENVLRDLRLNLFYGELEPVTNQLEGKTNV